jgi:3-dehydroquinate synthase
MPTTFLASKSGIGKSRIGGKSLKSLFRSKREVVEKDPKEAGLRKILNFGHTIGHAFESFYLDTDKHLLHGEAIAVGMVCEAFLSHKKSGLPKEDLQTITEP